MEDTKIIDFNAQQVAKDALAETTAKQEERANLIHEIVEEANSINPNLGDFENFALLLQLPEEQFELVAPFYLEELEKTYNNTNEQMNLAAILNASNISFEDMNAELEEIGNIIDQMDDEVLSNSKKAFLKTVMGFTTNAVMDSQGIEKRILDVPVQLDEDAKLPVYAHVTDAGADIYSLEEIDIPAGEHKLIKTGVHLDIPKGYEVQVRCKSGIANKTNLIVKNGIGTVDEDYTGDVSIILANIAPPIKNLTLSEDGRVESIEYGKVEHIEKGQKIAQIVLSQSPKMHFTIVDKILTKEGSRGNNGFGSTGLK